MDQFIWWLCIFLEIVIVVRGCWARFERFAIFYAYIVCVLGADFSRMYIYKWHSNAYGWFYWVTEIVLSILSYGLIVGIYNQALKRYPGVSTFARVCLTVVLGSIAAKVMFDLFDNLNLSFAGTIVELEMYLGLTQAGLLVLLLFLLLYYKIPVGRNLRGLVAGYVFFIASSVMSFPFISDPRNGFSYFARKTEPTLYVFSLLIWLVSLWAYYPEPEVDSSHEILRDYEQLIREMTLALRRTRAYLFKVAGS